MFTSMFNTFDSIERVTEEGVMTFQASRAEYPEDARQLLLFIPAIVL